MASHATFKYRCNCDVSSNIGTCKIEGMPDFLAMTHAELVIHAKEQHMVQGVANLHLDFALAQIERKESFDAYAHKRYMYDGDRYYNLHQRIKELEAELEKRPVHPQRALEDYVCFNPTLFVKEVQKELREVKEERSHFKRRCGELQQLLDHEQKHGTVLSDADFDRMALWLEKRQVMEQSVLDKIVAQKNDTLNQYQVQFPRAITEYQGRIAELTSRVETLAARAQDLESRVTTESTNKDSETRKQLQEMEARLKQRETTYSQLHQKATEFRNALSTTDQKSRTKDEEKRVLQAEVDAEKRRYDNLNRTKQEFEKAYKQVEAEKKKEAAAAQEEKKGLRAEVEKLKRENQKLQVKVEKGSTCKPGCPWKAVSELTEAERMRIMQANPYGWTYGMWKYVLEHTSQICEEQMAMNTPDALKPLAQRAQGGGMQSHMSPKEQQRLSMMDSRQLAQWMSESQARSSQGRIPARQSSRPVQSPHQAQSFGQAQFSHPAHSPRPTQLSRQAQSFGQAQSPAQNQSSPQAQSSGRVHITQSFPQMNMPNGSPQVRQNSLPMVSGDQLQHDLMAIAQQQPGYGPPALGSANRMRTPQTPNTSMAPPSTPVMTGRSNTSISRSFSNQGMTSTQAAGSRGLASMARSTSTSSQHPTTARKAPSGLSSRTTEGYAMNNGASRAQTPILGSIGGHQIHLPGYGDFPGHLNAGPGFENFSPQIDLSSGAQAAFIPDDWTADPEFTSMFTNQQMYNDLPQNFGSQLQDSINASDGIDLAQVMTGSKRPASAIPPGYNQPAAQRRRLE